MPIVSSSGAVFGFGRTVRAVVPTITTIAVSSITQTTATSGGTVTADGGAPVTVRGVVWSTSPSPTVALATKTTDGTGTGTFASNITGLSAATTYYVRAYATNSAGTAYGSETSFATSASGSVTLTNIVLYLDAGNVTSYSGSGSTWTDLSPSAQNGTISGATYSSSNGGYFTFNGSSAYVSVSAVPGTGPSTYSQSYCFWVSPNDTDGNLFYMGSGGWVMPPMVVSGSKFAGTLYNNATITDPSTYTNNNWYYVCYVYNHPTTTHRLYVNGTLVASTTGAYIGSGSNNYVILAQPDPGSPWNKGWFSGRIAIVQLYTNRALTLSDIQGNFNADKARFGL
jgi:hypothetical protein